MNQRGAVHSPARAAQLRDFTGLRYGLITPSDIDAFIDFGGKAYVIIETKVVGNPLPQGQRLLLERLCDALNGSAHALVLIAEHNTPAHRPIDIARALVSEYRNHTGEWIRVPVPMITVASAVNQFLARCGLHIRYGGAA